MHMGKTARRFCLRRLEITRLCFKGQMILRLVGIKPGYRRQMGFRWPVSDEMEILMMNRQSRDSLGGVSVERKPSKLDALTGCTCFAAVDE